jgi:phage terminase small subunit
MPALTEAQQKFVDELVASGCTPTEAARRSGFAAPGQEAYRLMRKDHVVVEIRAQRERMISGHAANVAIKILVEIMTDKEAPASARVSAARTVCDAAGDFDRDQASDRRKPMEEMTMDQLQKLVTAIDEVTQQRASGHFN